MPRKPGRTPRGLQLEKFFANGHEYTPENTGMRPGTGSGNGGRVCRKCVVIRHREYVNRKRLPNASAE